MPSLEPEQSIPEVATPRRRPRPSSRRNAHFGDEPIRYTVSSLPEGGEVTAEESSPARTSRQRPAEERFGDPPVPPRRFARDLDDGRIDPDAAKVVTRLVRGGHEAYLVGGCVRDLLLGRSTNEVKDFDVATSARPEVVRELFRNCRVIGRRFRLAHVIFGNGKVIETATFRRNPTDSDKTAEDDLLIRDDNVFGEAHEDARRRDFTINALFYDLQTKEVLDWCQGMSDIEQRSVRTIGDPLVRFREDPVRMLRAVKFAARLDLGIDPTTYDAIVQCRSCLAQAARPRLFEELLRLMRGGGAHRAIWLCWELGLLDVLLPELSSYLYDIEPDDDRVFRLLDQIDWLSLNSKEPVDDIVVLTLLLHQPLSEVCDSQRDRITAAYEFLEPIVERLAMPRRIADAVRRVIAILPRLASGRAPKFQKTPLAGVADQVLACLRSAEAAGGTGLQPKRSRGSSEVLDGALDDVDPPSGTAGKRRRRRRRAPRAE